MSPMNEAAARSISASVICSQGILCETSASASYVAVPSPNLIVPE